MDASVPSCIGFIASIADTGVSSGFQWAWVYFIVSVSVAMVFSHCCSLMEAALLSISPSQLADLNRVSPRAGKCAMVLKQDIDKPLAVILIINTAAHTIGAAEAGASLNSLFPGNATVMSVFSLLFTLLMVQYTELLPKTLGVRFNINVMKFCGPVLQVLLFILMPIIKVTQWINKPFERRKPEKPTTTEEISALASLARSSQTISSRQERIIKMVPHLSVKNARDVMIDVENISFLTADQTLTDAMNSTANDFHTRYPVCEEDNKNEVLGYVNFKELVAIHRSHPGTVKVNDILRPIPFSAPDDSAAELLEQLTMQNCHITIVRDPATNTTLGLVTLEDIIEELLGDLDDEFDPLPRTFYSPGENFWVVGGGVPLRLLARDTHLDLPLRAEPVGVWVSRILDRPVRVGDVIRHGNAEFYVRKIRRGQAWEFNLKRMKE
ncbi:MAG: DUF21 domain-containing protein [Lentisphaeria bacterium]|nr:DUF21 domain-containing protein [Lentisphaeria bacterium]